MTEEQHPHSLVPCGDPLRNLVVQADTLAFTLDFAAALLENERPHLAALCRTKAQAARFAIHQVQKV
jgi:hypothetical protein